jgi:hypothetical protein
MSNSGMHIANCRFPDENKPALFSPSRAFRFYWKVNYAKLFLPENIAKTSRYESCLLGGDVFRKPFWV